MKSEVLRELLTEVAPTTDDARRVSFSDRDQVTLLVAAQGTSLAVEALQSAALHSGYVAVETAEGEAYFIGLEHVVGFRVRRGKREGAGFR
jgi:hypothetical protein